MDTILIAKIVVTLFLAGLAWKLFSTRAIFFGFFMLLCASCAGYSGWLQYTGITFIKSPVGKLMVQWHILDNVIDHAKKIEGNASAEAAVANMAKLGNVNSSNDLNTNNDTTGSTTTNSDDNTDNNTDNNTEAPIPPSIAEIKSTDGSQMITALSNTPKQTQFTDKAVADSIDLLVKNYLGHDVSPGITATFIKFNPEKDGYEAVIRLEGKFDGITNDCRTIDYFWQESLAKASGDPDPQLGIDGIQACSETNGAQ